MDEPTVVMFNEKLARVAGALDRIADALERAHPTPEQVEDRQFRLNQKAMRVADAIDAELVRVGKKR